MKKLKMKLYYFIKGLFWKVDYTDLKKVRLVNRKWVSNMVLIITSPLLLFAIIGKLYESFLEWFFTVSEMTAEVSVKEGAELNKKHIKAIKRVLL